MVVTDVAPFDAKRRKVYIDNEYAFPLYLSELRKFGIKTDVELAEDVYSEIVELLNKRVKERILYLIGDMDRTEKNIRDKLRGSGYVGGIVDNVIDKLKLYGYIDDVRYVRIYAESMRDNGSKSIRAIEASLYEKGVSKENISLGMSGIDFDEDEQIRRAVRKKGFSEKSPMDADDTEKRKLYGYLMRKGFSHEAISNIIRK